MLAHPPPDFNGNLLPTGNAVLDFLLLITKSKCMKFLQSRFRRDQFSPLFKLLVIMKLSILLVLLSVIEVQAKVHAQGAITLTMQQAEIGKVLNKIEKKTIGEYRFLYNYDLPSLRKKVDIHFEQSSIKDVLDRLFINTDLTYKMLENNLIVVMSPSGGKQDIRITGKVTGTGGVPLSGVSVQVKGSTTGTSTGNDGQYSITAGENATLKFSYIGYQDKEVAVNGQNVVNVELTVAQNALDQVVV